MGPQQILDELLVLMEQQQVRVRSEPLGGSGGGLCRVGARTVFFLDTQASSLESAVQCARALCQLLDMEAVYLRPATREFVEIHAVRIDNGHELI